MGCTTCGAEPPERDDEKWVGWLTGTIRRVGKTGELSDAVTFAACAHERVYIVERQKRLRGNTRVLVEPSRRPSGCYGCRKPLLDGSVEIPGTARIRMMRALPTMDAYLNIRTCGDCSMEIRPLESVDTPEPN